MPVRDDSGNNKDRPVRMNRYEATAMAFMGPLAPLRLDHGGIAEQYKLSVHGGARLRAHIPLAERTPWVVPQGVTAHRMDPAAQVVRVSVSKEAVRYTAFRASSAPESPECYCNGFPALGHRHSGRRFRPMLRRGALRGLVRGGLRDRPAVGIARLLLGPMPPPASIVTPSLAGRR